MSPVSLGFYCHDCLRPFHQNESVVCVCVCVCMKYISPNLKFKAGYRRIQRNANISLTQNFIELPSFWIEE